MTDTRTDADRLADQWSQFNKHHKASFEKHLHAEYEKRLNDLRLAAELAKKKSKEEEE